MLVEGTFAVDAPHERVWRYITDPALMAPCVPGCDSVEVIDPLHYKARVKIELGPIKAGFNLDIEITEQSPPDSIHSTTRGEEGSRASIVSARNLLRLETLDERRTEVRYSSEVSLTGRLGKFGLGMMRKKAEQLGKQFAERFCARVVEAETALTS
jgi:uncharacterized protein